MTRIAHAVVVTEAGHERVSNGDAVLRADHLPLYAVADGLGGAEAGEVAAATAVAKLLAASPAIADAIRSGGATAHERVREILERAFHEAHRAIEAEARTRRAPGMGTTLVTAAVVEDRALVLHVGDSRAYLLRDGQLRRLTQDHSITAFREQRGTLTPEEARTHADRYRLYQAVGTGGDIDVDVAEAALADGDVLLLCSNGLSGPLDDTTIAALLTAEPTLDLGAAALRRAVAAAGQADDVSFILFAIEGERQSAEVRALASAVRDNFLFAGLSDADLARVTPFLRERAVAAGEVIVREGDPADDFFLVAAGEARVSRGGTFLVDVGRGGYLGELALIAAGTRSATATALQDTRLVVLTRADFHTLARRRPDVASVIELALLRTVGDRLRDLTDRVHAESNDVDASLTRAYMARARQATLTAPLATVLLAWVSLEATNRASVAAWLALVTLADLATFVHTSRFLARTPADADTARWRRRQTVLHALAGLAWGSSGWLLTSSTGHHGFLEPSVIWLVGVTAINAATMSAYRSAFLIFQCLAWMPTLQTLLGRWTFVDGQIALGIVILSAIEQHYAHTLQRQTVDALSNATRLSRTSADLTRAQVEVARANEALTRNNAELEAALVRITELATRDALTGLFNRRHVTARLAELDADGDTDALIFVDLDHFKKINDTYGHAGGDAVLVEAGRRIRACLRDGDIAGRWGGEEFVVVLRSVTPAAAAERAERLRCTLADTPASHEGAAIGFTGSLGVAVRGYGEPTDAWIERADAACYLSKKGGRNRVEIAADVVSPTPSA